MQNPTLDFLVYLVKKCIEQCEVDPDKTTVTEFLQIIEKAGTPLGF